ncbi:unnamed protein product [Prunus brigantina]
MRNAIFLLICWDLDRIEPSNLDIWGFCFNLLVKSISQGAEGTLPSPPLRTPDTVAGTSSQLPAALPPTSPCLGTPDIAASTSPYFQQCPPRGEIIDDIHKDGDASTSMGHLSEKSMSWQDWENSFMAFKAFFDGGVTHSMKSSHGSVSFETIGCMGL